MTATASARHRKPPHVAHDDDGDLLVRVSDLCAEHVGDRPLADGFAGDGQHRLVVADEQRLALLHAHVKVAEGRRHVGEELVPRQQAVAVRVNERQ